VKPARHIAVLCLITCTSAANGQQAPQDGVQAPQPSIESKKQPGISIEHEGVSESAAYCFVSSGALDAKSYESAVKTLLTNLRNSGRQSFAPTLRFAEPQSAEVISGKPIKGAWMACADIEGWNPPKTDDASMQRRLIPAHVLATITCVPDQVDKCGENLIKHIVANHFLVVTGPHRLASDDPKMAKLAVGIIAKPHVPAVPAKKP
jgi:hypothetical protein